MGKIEVYCTILCTHVAYSPNLNRQDQNGHSDRWLGWRLIPARGYPGGTRLKRRRSSIMMVSVDEKLEHCHLEPLGHIIAFL